MSKLLFESKGAPQKRKKVIRALAIVLLVLAIALIFAGFKAPRRDRSTAIGIGTGIAALSGLVYWCADKGYANKSSLRIYDNHIEGVDSSFSNVPFSFTYKEIINVSKISVIGNDMLTIEHNGGTTGVLVNEIQRAYDIVNQKLDEMEGRCN